MTRSERIYEKEVYAQRQAKIARLHGIVLKSGKHVEKSATTCGRSTCAMCGNPRKIFHELTIQEKRLFQDID